MQRKSDGAIISGTMHLNSSADKEFGKKCSIHTDMDVSNSNLGTYNLKFNYDGCNFLYYNENENEEQELAVRYIRDSIYHNVSTDFDENGKWQTRNIAGATKVYSGKQIRKYNTTQKRIDGHIEDVDYDEDMVDVVDKEDVASLIQLGNEARSMMKDMPKTLLAIRKDLKVGQISLLDSFISTTFGNEQLVNATFGYTPHEVAWQNGASSLREAYFGDYSTTFSALHSGENELIK